MALIMEYMNVPELEKVIDQVKVALVPVGSCEQHGPNSTYYTDSGRADAFAKALAERMGNKVLAFPPVTYGLSEHHMDFVGTVTLKPETLAKVYEDICVSISKHGINKILFIIGHGGNSVACEFAAITLKMKYGIQAFWAGFGSRTARGGLTPPGYAYGHADEFEVSSTLGLCPQYVKDEMVPGIMQDSLYTRGFWGYAPSWKYDVSLNGCLNDARKSSMEIGLNMKEEALNKLEKIVEDIIAYENKSKV